MSKSPKARHRIVTHDRQEYSWDHETITGCQLRELLKWDPEVPMVIDLPDGTRTQVDDDDQEFKLDHHCRVRPHWCYEFEDEEFPWPRPRIKGSDLRERHNIPADVPIVLEDEDGHETEISNDDVVHLGRPCRFGVSAIFKRGLAPRWEKEISHLRESYPQLTVDDNGMVTIPEFPLPNDLYNRTSTTLWFLIPPGYAQTPPDNFFVETGLRFKNGRALSNYSDAKDTLGKPAGVFSWHPEKWRPAENPHEGDSLYSFIRCVRSRLKETN